MLEKKREIVKFFVRVAWNATWRRESVAENTFAEAAMFGSKKEKEARLTKLMELVEQNPEQFTPKDLARLAQTARSTITRDLAALEERGVLLAEDERARLSLFRRIFRK